MPGEVDGALVAFGATKAVVARPAPTATDNFDMDGMVGLERKMPLSQWGPEGKSSF